MERVFTLKKGTEFPDRFAGTTVTLSTIEANYPSPADFGEAAVASVGGDVETACALFASAHLLQQQKDVKELAASKDATIDGRGEDNAKAIQWLIDAAGKIVVKARLRGTGTGTRKVSEKVKVREEKASERDALYAAMDLEIAELYEARFVAMDQPIPVGLANRLEDLRDEDNGDEDTDTEN